MNSARKVCVEAVTGEILLNLVRCATGVLARLMGTTLGGGVADLVWCVIGSMAVSMGATLGGDAVILGGGRWHRHPHDSDPGVELGEGW
jgi:hypothetical protein